MVIVKKDDATTVFDVNRIADAIFESCMLSEELLWEIENRIPEIIQTIYNNIVRFFSTSYSVRLKKKPICFLISLVPLQIPDLKTIENTFLENASKVRKVYLLSKHHRGNTYDFNAIDKRNPKMAI